MNYVVFKMWQRIWWLLQSSYMTPLTTICQTIPLPLNNYHVLQSNTSTGLVCLQGSFYFHSSIVPILHRLSLGYIPAYISFLLFSSWYSLIRRLLMLGKAIWYSALLFHIPLILFIDHPTERMTDPSFLFHILLIWLIDPWYLLSLTDICIFRLLMRLGHSLLP